MKRKFVRIASVTLAATMGLSTMASTGLATEGNTSESYSISAAATTTDMDLDVLYSRFSASVTTDMALSLIAYKGQLVTDATKNDTEKKRILDAYVALILKDIAETDSAKKLKVGQYADMALTLTALGYNAASIPNGDKTINIIDIIYNFGQTNISTLEDYVSTLLAYDSGNYYVKNETGKISREFLKGKVTSYYTTNPSGATKEIINNKAKIITALSPYKTETVVKTKINSLLTDFKPTDTIIDITTATNAIIALISQGLDPEMTKYMDGSLSFRGVIDSYRTGKADTATPPDKNKFAPITLTTDSSYGYGLTKDRLVDIPYDITSTKEAFRGLVAYENYVNNGNEPYNFYSFGNREQADKVTMEIKNLNTAEILLKDSFQIEKGVTTKVSDVLDKLSKDKGIEVVYGTKEETKTDGTKIKVTDKSIIIKIGSTDASVNGTWKIIVDGKAATGETAVVNGNVVSVQYDSLSTIDKDREAIINGYINQTAVLSPSQAIAILTSGNTLTDARKKSIIDTAKTSTTNLGLSGIVLDKAGKDTLDVDGTNFAKKVYDSTTLKSNIESYALGLITLTNATYVPVAARNTVSDMVSYLTSIQNTNGSFGTTSDIELTATVLTALAPYRENRAVEAVINKGFNFIKSEKDTNSVVKYNTSSKAISKIIIALTANGIDPKSSEYSVAGKNLMDNLLTFKTGGEFSKDRTTTKDSDSTLEAVKALIAYEKYTKGEAHIYFKEKADDLLRPYYEAFKDEVNISEWAKKEVEKAREIGVVAGGGDGYVNPKNNITRAEFVKILVGIKGLTPTDGKTSSFSDVKANEWYTGYIEKAYQQKLVTGTDSKNFSPNAFVTREEMATMIYRAYGLKATTSKTKMSDDKEISPYASNAVYTIYDNEIMKGVGGTISVPVFNPSGKASREMAFTTIIRTLEKLEYKF